MVITSPNILSCKSCGGPIRKHTSRPNATGLCRDCWRKSNLELLNKNQHMRDHNKGYKDGFEKGLMDGRKEALKRVVEWLLDNELHPERDGLELSGKSLLALLDEVKE